MTELGYGFDCEQRSKYSVFSSTLLYTVQREWLAAHYAQLGSYN